MLAGGLSGIAGWASTYPFDVVKTVIQNDPNITRPHSKAIPTFKCFANHLNGVYGNNVSSLFRGFWATVLRAFPTNVAILSTWHLTMEWFRRVNIA